MSYGTAGQGGQAGDDGEGLAQKLIGELAQVKAELRRAQEAIGGVERRRTVERAAVEAQARDVQAAADAIEQRLSAGATDVAQALREIKRERPGLFGVPARAGVEGGDGAVSLTALRERARTGDRASLLLYLQARREKP